MFFLGYIIILAIIFGEINIGGIVTYFTYFFVTSGAAYKLHTIKSKWQQQDQSTQQQPVAGQVVLGQVVTGPVTGAVVGQVVK